MDRLASKTLVSLVLVLGLSTLLFFFVDKPCIFFLAAHKETLASLAHPISALAKGNIWQSLLALGLLILFYHDYRYGSNRGSKELFYILLSIMIASLLGENLKFLLARYRPTLLLSQGQYGFSFLVDHWSQNSTPSGHTFRAFSLMTALGLTWPRYRWLFLTPAILIALSRVILLDHYPSDIVLGAYLGILSALWARWFLFYNELCQ